jgi:hypothetical protein
VSRKNLSPQQLEGRLKNAAAQLLLKKLIVPKIFIEANWPDRHSHVDVLALDRAGAGDIHVVDAKSSLDNAYLALPNFINLPAHYKYLTLFQETGMKALQYLIDESQLYALDGIGRVGVIAVHENPADKSLHAEVVIAPERFRITYDRYQQVDRFLESHAADLEIRER